MHLADVKHQEAAIRSLYRALDSGRMSHALIFHGPEGVGREMTALAWGQLLVCSGTSVSRATATALKEKSLFGDDQVDEAGGAAPSGAAGARRREPCGQCDDCRLAQAGNHPDIHLVHRRLKDHHPDAEVRNRKGLNLSIDVVREFLINRVGSKPARGKFKLFIVREAELLSDAAQNALLKTLEEPPADTGIILITHALDRLFPTIRSRCLAVPFRTLPDAFVRARLGQLKPDIPEVALTIMADLSQGSLGRAIQLAEDGMHEIAPGVTGALCGLNRRQSLTFSKMLLDQAEELSAIYQKRDDEITDTEAQRRALKTLFLVMAAWYRDRLREPYDVLQLCFPRPDAPPALAPEATAAAVRQLALAERTLDLNANVQLVVDALAIRLARLHTRVPAEKVG